MGAAGTESSGVFSWKIITDGFLAEQDLEIRLKRSVFGTNGLTLNATIAPVLLATTCGALMAQPTHSDDVVEHPEGLIRCLRARRSAPGLASQNVEALGESSAKVPYPPKGYQ